MSHGNIINIRKSLVGATLDSPGDVVQLHQKALRNGLDIQQIHHAYSGADIALWDIVGQKLGEPIYRLLEPHSQSHSKLPYASVLFGDTPEETYQIATQLREQGYCAAKFGWGPMGQFGEENDVALVRAAREGMGEDAQIMIDAGVVWGDDYETAYARTKQFAQFSPTWLEEPLAPDAIEAYMGLSKQSPPVPIAAGEGSGTYRMAEDLILHGGIQFVQIDVGRIGGITGAFRVRQLAEQHGVQYVNHTFKSHLSLAASLHVFATNESFDLLEYPAEGSELSQRLTMERLKVGSDGKVALTGKPGLGVHVDTGAMGAYLTPVQIQVGNEIAFEPVEL
jgi:L-alanine-DL-glutamate epimerase-like enolase superfamily enzyme